jgi:hypothetical protein
MANPNFVPPSLEILGAGPIVARKVGDFEQGTANGNDRGLVAVGARRRRGTRAAPARSWRNNNAVAVIVLLIENFPPRRLPLW